LLPIWFEKSRQVRGGPQEKHAINSGLQGKFAIEVLPQQLETGGDFGRCAIVAWCNSNGNGSQRGSEVGRIVRFPRLVFKAQPEPAAFVIATNLLFGPHVLKRRMRVIAELAGLRITARKNQCVENGFCSA